MDLKTAVQYVTAGYQRYTLKVGATEVLMEPFGAHEIVVVVRGSDEAADWWDNLDAERVLFFDEPGAEVHRGFFTSYLGARQDIFGRLQGIDPFQRKMLRVLGHSQGGAKGYLFAADAMRQGYTTDRVKVRTFGCPRVGNAAFAELFADVDADRFIHGYDPVPLVPFRSSGYEHIGFPVQGWSWWHTWLPIIRRLPSRIARDHRWKNYARCFGG